MYKEENLTSHSLAFAGELEMTAAAEVPSPSLVGEGGGVALTNDLCFSNILLSTPEIKQEILSQILRITDFITLN